MVKRLTQTSDLSNLNFESVNGERDGAGQGVRNKLEDKLPRTSNLVPLTS